MALLVALYVVIAVVTMLVALPLMRGRLPPNPWVGFRTPRTLRDPALWYAVNAYGGRLLFAVGVAFLAAAVVLAFVPGIDAGGYAVGGAVVLGLGLTAWVLLTFRYLARRPDKR